MKLFLSVVFCCWLQFTFAQKLDISSLERILDASVSSADSILKKLKFGLADQKSENGYYNYYYTSYEKKDTATQLLRSLTIMDIYTSADTSRFMLYRTYTKDDQQEMERQLAASGYQLAKRTANDFEYKKGAFTITNRITEKNVGGIRKVTVYEFELGR